jgi:hypothetical protein
MSPHPVAFATGLAAPDHLGLQRRSCIGVAGVRQGASLHRNRRSISLIQTRRPVRRQRYGSGGCFLRRARQKQHRVAAAPRSASDELALQ